MDANALQKVHKTYIFTYRWVYIEGKSPKGEDNILHHRHEDQWNY